MAPMHVVERGAGTPIVLIHGFSPDHRVLLPLDPVLERHGGWRRIYPDLPGMGLSPAGTDAASSDTVADAVARLISERIGAEPFALVGNSFGGMLARRLAHDFRPQVLGLCLVAPVIVADPARRDVPKRVMLKEDPELLASLSPSDAEKYALLSVIQSRENWQLFNEFVKPGVEIADQDALAAIRASYALRVEPEEADPTPFVQPTLFITGRQDSAVGYADALKVLSHYPHAAFYLFDQAGHNVHLDQLELTRAAFEEWLDRMRNG